MRTIISPCTISPTCLLPCLVVRPGLVRSVGTDGREVLLNKAIHLQHGWVGVVNRSQADINGRVDMATSRQKEGEYFQSVPAYRDLSNVGTAKLTSELSAHLE